VNGPAPCSTPPAAPAIAVPTTTLGPAGDADVVVLPASVVVAPATVDVDAETVVVELSEDEELEPLALSVGDVDESRCPNWPASWSPEQAARPTRARAPVMM
jgi:hypothetical protein